jgi:hypothetical protein
MAKLIVKPAINFLSTSTDAELQMETKAIVSKMEASPDDFPDPTPPLPVIAAKNREFESALSAAADGGKLLTLEKNNHRAELVLLMKTLANYVALVCDRDLLKLMKSGFPIHKPTRHAIGRLPAPATPALRHTTRCGEMAARTRTVRGVFVYNWQVALASAPDEIVRTQQSTGTSTVLVGLIPGELYLVRVNAVGAAGPSGFSGWGRQRAL